MIKLILFVFVSTTIATGYLQEVSNDLLDPSPNNDNSGTTKQLWQQFQGLRRNGKPCPRRSNSNPDGQWVPSYSTRITHPLYEPMVFQPQALKNEELRESQVTATSENDHGQDFQDHQDLASGRRSFQYISSLNLETDDDLADQLGTVSVESTEPSAKTKALKISEDCLKKVAKNNQGTLGSSRRSMPDTDSIYNDENNDLPNSVTDDLLEGNKVDETDAGRKGDSKKSSNLEDRSGLVNSGSQYGNSLSNYRICYACSTATNPTCWEPDKRTTIKYCSKETSCVTKTFGVKNQVTLIRDCAKSCTDTSVPGIEPKYKSCKICHKDYCNSAIGVAINVYSLAVVMIISIVKCTY